MDAAIRRRVRSPTILIIGGALLSLVVIAAAVVAGWNARRHALAEASRELRNMSLVLADHTDRALQAVELAANSVIDRARGEGAFASAASFDAWARSDRAHAMLRARADALPQVDALVFVDQAGRVSGSSRFFPPPPNDLSDRAYFQAVREGASRFIGPTVENRGTGTQAFHVAKRVEGANGGFLGVLVAVIELAYFENLYATLSLGAQGSVALFRADNTLLVSHPPVPGTIGRDHSHRQRLIMAQQRQTGDVARLHGMDGVDRLVSARHLTAYPLHIHVGAAVDTVLLRWRGLLAQAAVAVLVLIALIIVGVVVATRAIRAEEQAAGAVMAFEQEAAREKLRHQQALAAKDAEFRVVVQGMSQGVWLFNEAGELTLANQRAADLLGIPYTALIRGMPVADIIHAAVAHGAGHAVPVIRYLGLIAGSRRYNSFDHHLPGRRVVSIIHQPLPGSGWLATFEDITARYNAEARVRYLAEHDDLTGSVNRTQLMRSISQVIGARNAAHEPGGDEHAVALIYLDLDRFKEVNDTLGYSVGDGLLRQVASRLHAGLQAGGQGDHLVARFGGDEFVIMLDIRRTQRGQRRAHVEHLANGMAEALREAFSVDGYRIMVGTTIGIAIHPEDGATGEALVRAADLALRHGKRAGRGRCWFFERAMEAEMQARLELETELRRALLNGHDDDFALHFQPIMDITTHRPAGFEALVRWQRGGRQDPVSPAFFIPLAEETGLICELDALVMRRACAEAAAWPGDDLRVAVNVSPISLRAPGFIKTVTDALAASGLDASRLEIEVTEGVFIKDTEKVIAVMHELRALGVSFAMDDFGTGYSALSYLRSFPFERVKIDRAFIRDIENNKKGFSIVHAIVKLCLDLDMVTLIEGVETESQLRMAERAGCREAQGYLFSRPVRAADVPATLRGLRLSPAASGPQCGAVSGMR